MVGDVCAAWIVSGEGLVQQQPWAPQFSQLQQSVVATWRMVWQVLSSYSGPAVRMHLAFFYFFGLYYHWSKRVTGKYVACRLKSCVLLDPCRVVCWVHDGRVV